MLRCCCTALYSPEVSPSNTPQTKSFFYPFSSDKQLITFPRVKIDLENPRGSMLSGCPEEGSISVVVFSLTGRASPHLHNGVLHVGDEDTYVSYLPLSSSLDFYFHRNRQGCAAMGSPGKERGRISGARGRRRIEQTTRLPLEDPQPADLGHPLPGSSRCPVQYEPRAAQKLPRGATVRKRGEDEEGGVKFLFPFSFYPSHRGSRSNTSLAVEAMPF